DPGTGDVTGEREVWRKEQEDQEPPGEALVEVDDERADEERKPLEAEEPAWNQHDAPALAVERTSADSRSAIRSSADSIPTESRMRLRGAANGESAVDACVICAGCSIRLSTPPSDSARVQTLVRATISTASSSEPARNEIIPPKSDIWRLAISCPGWVGSPG